MTPTQFKRFTLTSRFWMFLAVFWVIRGVDIVVAGIGHGYSWLKHGFPAERLRDIDEVSYSGWVRLVCFVFGIVILIRQHRHKTALDAPSSDPTV